MADNKSKNSTFKAIGEMPHNLEAEQALLGCLILDPSLPNEVASFIKEEDFYAESHKLIFNAMSDLIRSNLPIDIVTLSDMMDKHGTLVKAGGIEYLTTLLNVIPSSANYQKYVDIVTRDSLNRRLILGSAEIIDNSKKSLDKVDALSFAEKTIFEISNTEDTSTIVPISSIIPEVMTKLDELAKEGSPKHGIKTKYRGLDNLLNGLHNSDLVILAARPAVGKTSFAMNIVENVASQGYSCAVFSLEMGKEQIAQRLLFSVAGVSMERAMKGQINKTEWIKIAKARDVLSKCKIYVDDSAIVTPQQILSKCRRLKRKHGLDLVVVDYIQLMSPDKNRKSDNRQQEITEISRNLKILAKEINIPVIALSQLSRAVETRKGRPVLADLRESGAIEQDADIVMFIHRPDKSATEKELAEGTVKQNVAEIIIEKHRSGPTGLIKLYFKGEYTKFVNYNDETGEVEGGETAFTNNETQKVEIKEYENKEDSNKLFKDEEVVKSVDDEIF